MSLAREIGLASLHPSWGLGIAGTAPCRSVHCFDKVYPLFNFRFTEQVLTSTLARRSSCAVKELTGSLCLFVTNGIFMISVLLSYQASFYGEGQEFPENSGLETGSNGKREGRGACFQILDCCFSNYLNSACVTVSCNSAPRIADPKAAEASTHC
jgi:hypothetical protein